MRKLFASLILTLCAFEFSLSGIELYNSSLPSKKIVTSTKRIYIPECPGAYNPSITKFKDNYLLSFRYLPNRYDQQWISYIGVVILDESFEPISKAQLLDTRLYNTDTPSQSEDARIFFSNDRLYVIYNDNMELTFPSLWERRDMYIAEVFYPDNQFFLSEPIRLIHETKHRHTPWQKNWSPFEWKGKLMLSYMINPHEVLCPNFSTGICQHYCQSHKPIMWNLGALRGGTPAQLVDGEYLAFFHSGIVTSSSSSDNRDLWHYFMGAYTFSAEPPFEVTYVSEEPIVAPGFYTYSSYDKRVIYPGGFVVEGSNIYVAYGKDDSEVWIGTISIPELKNSLKPVK